MVFVASSTCFVAIPEGSEFDGIRQAVTATLDEFTVMPLDPVSQSSGSSVPNFSDIMERVDFVIADVSSESADIFYQLGVADALRKPALIMARKQVLLPGDLARRQLLLYGPGEVLKLVDYLRYWIPDVISLQRKRNAAIR